MADNHHVEVSVRVTEKNQATLERTRQRLLEQVAKGEISADHARTRMTKANLRLTEYRIGNGPWRPLRDCAPSR